MICARSRSLALVVVSYNCRSSVTWVSDKGGKVRGLAIVPFRKEGQHHIPPALYRKYFLEAFRAAAARGMVGRAARPPSQREQDRRGHPASGARGGLGGDGEGPHAPPAAGGGGGRPHPGAGPTRRAAGDPRGGARLGPTVADRCSQGLRDGVPHPVGPWAAPPTALCARG